MTPNLQNLSAPGGAAWWPAAAVAPSLGISRDLMLAAIERGELPIRRIRFGARGLVFLSRADVLAYLKTVNEESPA